MGSSTDEQNLWKESISEEERIHHELLFYSQGPVDGYLSGDRARDVFLHSKLPLPVLSQIWNLADVSNDNVLSVEEFVLAMHLILRVTEGLPIPRSLPKHLVPTVTSSPQIPDISVQEREAYQNVFNKLSLDQIDAVQGRLLMLQSELSLEELSQVWDLSDVNRDGQLNRQEWNVSCHLMRYLKQGRKLTGPVNVFQLLPQCLSPVCYQSRKNRVEEYNNKKNQLIAAKDKRKSQIDNETRRLELLKKRYRLHKELYESSKSTDGWNIPEVEYNLYREKEESNIEKVEAVIYRLKKEHEKIRQQTVQAILEEKGSLQQDAQLIKAEQDEVRQRLATYRTKATKDPDPFHQLYELRKELRKRSTLSEGEEPEVHFPFINNPFSKETLRPKLSGHSIFISPDPSVFSNNNGYKEAAVLRDLCGFGEGFLEKWSNNMTSNPEKDPDYDPVFMSLKVPMEPRSWSGIEWSETGSGTTAEIIHQKLVDLKLEMEKLTYEAGGQLLFRNPEDYLAKQKAQEEEERLEKSKYQRKYGGDKRSERDVTKRRSYIPTQSVDVDAQRAREYRQKRRSLNLDKKSDQTDTSKKDVHSAHQGESKKSDLEKRSKQTELTVSTDKDNNFAPESASSPRVKAETGSESSPVRSSTSPPRPSTKRKAAPLPPSSPKSETTSGLDTPQAKSPDPLVAPAKSLHSKIPKPVTNQESLNSKDPSPQKEQKKSPAVEIDNTCQVEVSTVQTKSTSNLQSEIKEPSRPPRRKKKSEEDKSFLHENIQKEQTRQSKDLAVGVNLTDNILDKSEITVECSSEQSKPDDNLQESYSDKENSLLDSILRELPSAQNRKLAEESDSKISDRISAVASPASCIEEEVISPAEDSGVECEIKPEVVDKPRGILIGSDITGTTSIEFKDKEIEGPVVDTESEDEQVVLEGNLESEQIIAFDEDEADGYIDHIKPVAFSKRTENLLQAFEKIRTLPEKEYIKDNRDTCSIASDISVSSSSSEPPPLPETAPPTLSLSESVDNRGKTETESKEVEEVIKSVKAENIETSPVMADEVLIPEITKKASPREVRSPIEDLKASMFSMRVTSPTRDSKRDAYHNGELTIDTGRRGSNSDSDVSDDGEQVQNTRGTFTPGERVTKDVPMETQDDDGTIQLISYNGKLNSPNSDHSGPDSAFEDMQSSMTSNDPLSNTLDEFGNEDYVTAEKTDRVETSPQKEVKSFVLEFDTDRPKGGLILSPTGNKNFMAKAQQFADTVQRPPKMTVKRKKEINSPDDLTDERYLQLEAERRAVISSSTMKKKNIVVATAYDEDTPVENQAPENPDDAVQEWRSEVSKRSNIPWEEKPEKVNLYSENIIQETENTEAVDRESIANLSKARQQWENKTLTSDSGNSTPRKPKQTPQHVRHWEVKLPTQLKQVPADVIRTTKQDSDSDSEIMADTEYSNESAIEREIRLAMEREELLKKEQEERANLQERQMSSLKKEPFEKNIEQNNNKPTFHEMTEADRGSELQQREEQIQQEIQDQQEREAAVRGTNGTYQDSSHSSEEEEDNANESIIEREIRLQQERELELEQRRQQLAKTQIQETEQEDDGVEEETVTVEYTEEVHMSPPVSTHSETPASTPDNLSETEEQGELKSVARTRISYEEAISSAAHEGESLIARELREAREREEELQRQRLLAGSGAGKSSQTSKQAKSPSVKEQAVSKPVDNQKPSYQQDVGPYKHERKNSTDSLSSGHSSEKPQNVTPKNVRVATFGGGKIGGFMYTVPDKSEERKRQETPIEREIRIAREKENELRIAKGLPPLKDETKVEFDTEHEKEREKETNVTKSSFFSHGTPSRGENIQRFASSRLQKEINKQTELEKKYRDEGKIISTSEEHVGLIKYSEIAQEENTTTPRRNFSINRKSTSSEPVVENKQQNGTPEPKQSSKVSTPDQPAPKYSRSVSSGNVTFSYKESRHKAESKIEQELREMREREEELRNQRNNAGIVSPSSPRSPDSTSVVNKRSHFEQIS